MGAPRVGGKAAYNTVSVGAAAVLIAAARQSRKSITIQNVHATQTLFLGSDSSVTTANGLRVAAAGGSITIDDYLGPIYGIGSGAATDTRYLEIYD